MAVFDVIIHDKISDLQDLLQSNPKCANSVGWHGLTPLHQAVLKNNQEIVNMLLEYDANLNQPNSFGETPFHFACQTASLHCVNKFVEIGADLRAEDSAGRTCIHHAAKGGSVSKLHYLVACGVSLKKRDNRGMTALHVAAELGHVRVCEYLLRNKRFAPDVKDSANTTPLHLAAKYAHCEVAWALESRSTLSMINVEDAMKKSPVDYAGEGKTPRHLWLQRHLKYWKASRCPHTRPPSAWMPWFMLLLSPSCGILLIVQAFYHLSAFFALFSTVAIIVFSSLWLFSQHRMRHISGLQNPAFSGFFFGLITQSLLCYFLYLVPQLWPEFLWTFLAVILLIFTSISLRKLFSDPGIVKYNRISDTGETLTILDVAKGVISEDDFCWVCEIVMPKLTKHCRLCDACMLSLDHHCLFLTRCVACNNHRSFVLFMIEILLANAFFVRAALSYFNLKVSIGESSSFRASSVPIKTKWYCQEEGFLYSPHGWLDLLISVTPGVIAEAMGQDIYVSVLFVTNCFGFFYVLFLTFFQFKVISDGGTTYYSSDGRAMHRTWKNFRRFTGVPWSQRMKIFSQFLLGEYSFYKKMMKEQAHQLV